MTDDPKKKYIVKLDDAEREQLQQMLRAGKHPTRKLTRARILLKAASGWNDDRIAAALGIGRSTVERTRQSFVERGLEAINERPRPGKKPMLMEEVLDLYATAYDPRRPKVNFDESSKQLIKETRTPLPAQPGQLERSDYDYECNGVRNLFIFVEPQA